MRTLVHLSDLHFGKVDAALLAPLRALVERLEPDVVVVSGDLTQRARSVQFQQARQFLDSLPGRRSWCRATMTCRYTTSFPAS